MKDDNEKFYMKGALIMNTGSTCVFEKSIPSSVDLGFVTCPKCGSLITDEKCACGVSKKAVSELRAIPLDLLRGRQKNKVVDMGERRRRKKKGQKKGDIYAFPVRNKKEVMFAATLTTCACGGTADEKGKCRECEKDLIMG